MPELLSGRPLERWSFTRRGFLRLALSATAGVAAGRLLPAAAPALAGAGGRRGRVKACILLFMGGGASQLETFDPKPGTEIGGEQKTIPTTVPGLEINEYLPHLARQMHRLSVIRSMDTREGNHARAIYYLHTGHRVQGGLQHPALGSVAGEQLGSPGFALPHYVAISQRVGHHLQGPMPSGGYLGPAHAPFLIDDVQRPVDNIQTWGGIDRVRFEARAALREALDLEMGERHASPLGAQNRELYRRAIRMMHSPLAAAFELEREPPAMRELYGGTASGQCFLLARRLIEAGVTFVEVLLNGWDTHGNHFKRSVELNGQLDRPFAALLADLEQRGLLDETLVVWMGEFGRTPAVNKQQGRDHWSSGWSVALGGGGLEGGRIVGATDANGRVKERPVSVEDLYATIGSVLGLESQRTYYTQLERPMKALPPGGRAVKELL
jgi:uncharacterized protein (DUF1501 family)